MERICLPLPGLRIVCWWVLGGGRSGPPSELVKSRTRSACGSCGCFCLDEEVASSNSHKGTTWVRGSSGFYARIDVGVDAPCKVQGQSWQFFASNLLVLLVLRCRSTRCAAQRSWVSSCCCVCIRNAMLSSPRTLGTVATSVSLALMVPFPTSPAISGSRATAP